MNGGFGLKKLTEENLEGCHKDARALRLLKARLFSPVANLTDVLTR